MIEFSLVFLQLSNVIMQSIKIGVSLMTKWIKTKLRPRSDHSIDEEYEEHIQDLIQNELVLSMKDYIQHSDIHCLEHCLYVSYSSYRICRRLGFDYRSAARGGMLHDFFLYDWHIIQPHIGLHGLVHSHIALHNANKHFLLNEIEKDVIQKHMWPLTIILPKYKEAFIVALVDKYCSGMEILNFRDKMKLTSLKYIPKCYTSKTSSEFFEEVGD